MTTEMAKEWVPMTQAMKLLDRSDSTIERLATDGRLQSKLIPLPGRKPQRVFLVADIERLKKVPKPAQTRHCSITVTDRHFSFDVGDGSIVVALPKTLSGDSLVDAIEFLRLVIRRLERVVKQH